MLFSIDRLRRANSGHVHTKYTTDNLNISHRYKAAAHTPCVRDTPIWAVRLNPSVHQVLHRLLVSWPTLVEPALQLPTLRAQHINSTWSLKSCRTDDCLRHRDLCLPLRYSMLCSICIIHNIYPNNETVLDHAYCTILIVSGDLV